MAMTDKERRSANDKRNRVFQVILALYSLPDQKVRLLSYSYCQPQLLEMWNFGELKLCPTDFDRAKLPSYFFTSAILRDEAMACSPSPHHCAGNHRRHWILSTTSVVS